MRVSKRPYGGAGPLSTHTEVKPQAGTSLESIKSQENFLCVFSVSSMVKQVDAGSTVLTLSASAIS